ncbi:Planctomycete cytochrome C [Aquisphaera giovannonii]|uniref:Planctomycete cytochrome C n=1 Tax=Aquisphaera giovannonii TaxID=406548 RepID=A0A5B9VYK8_9BACT|nr:c-type cytochrome domain-containing protein [Aquisphaera giovannonii]QEH32700.1 Planctomycete cytochrome C [Aquisphaera giovannonii]
MSTSRRPTAWFGPLLAALLMPSAERPASAQSPKNTAAQPPAEAASFRDDVAPILVANCVGCHSENRPGKARGKLDLTTFAKLMEGTPAEKVIAPGKPDESHLVLRVKGEEEPRMPQGGNNAGLADSAIARMERWIKAGAKLDAGLDPKAPIAGYAATPDQLRRNELARMSPEERDSQAEAAGRSRWKQANPGVTPELVAGDRVLLLSALPKDRAASAVKLLDGQHAQLRRVLGPGVGDSPEKVGLYVFNGRKDFVEFVRSVEGREIDADVVSTGNLRVPHPYLAAVDPLGGRKEEPVAARRPRPRGRRADDRDGSSPDRTLGGILTEALGRAAVASRGKSPQWLADGVGAFLGSQVEPRSPYYRKLRATALSRFRKGWTTPVNEVLGEGDQATADDIRGVGFALVEAMLRTPAMRGSFPAFAEAMAKGKDKLGDALKDVYQLSREEFMTLTGEWVGERYGDIQ